MNNRLWLELITSLPTENATERVRVWRTLKGAGAAVLRDGVYVLPDGSEREATLIGLAGGVDEAGGTAHLLRVEARDARQADDLRALFDRTTEYAELAGEIAAFRKTLSTRDAGALRRQMRAIQRQFEALTEEISR